MAQQPVVPHVLIFPFPAQGHVNCTLKLAELLALEGLHVTFLNTEYNHARLLKFTDAKTRFAPFPGFRFETITDGYPLTEPRNMGFFKDFLVSRKTVLEPAFRELLISGSLECDGRPPVTCIIPDALYLSIIDVAKEFGIPSVSFRTASACHFWAIFCLPKLIETGHIPFPEDVDMDELTTVPGMEGFVRRRDLPSFFRAKELNDWHLQFLLAEAHASIHATAYILNTFEDLEGPILSQMRHHFNKIYTIGPLDALLSARRTSSSPTYSSTSLLEVDQSCMIWLDSQTPKSVIYVSFGSVVNMSRTEMLEFWHGLVNSGKHFLWAIRPDLVLDKDEGEEIPKELVEGTKKRGYMVAWSPQEEVLKHPATGAFLTHSGWNSTLESIVASVPMLCWPIIDDQHINSRFVSEKWKIGLDMKDKCDRSTIERMVRDVMEDKSLELIRSMEKMTEKAKMCVSEEGSSRYNMDKLIQDIKSMSLGVRTYNI